MFVVNNVYGGYCGVVCKVVFQLCCLMVGQVFGLYDMFDVFVLCFSVVYVVDQNFGELLFDKNLYVVVLIVLILKLMMVMVVFDLKLLMIDQFEVIDEDCDYEKGMGLCLLVGLVLLCEDMLYIVLMVLENCVVVVLLCYYLGGCLVFIVVMNVKVKLFGMIDMYFENLIGLLSLNVLSVCDFVKMVNVVYQYLMICQFLIDCIYEVYMGKCNLVYNSINVLICGNGLWDIGLQKMGFINEVGECLVMQVMIYGWLMVMVLFDLFGKYLCFVDVLCLCNWFDVGGGECLMVVNMLSGGI